MFRVVAALGLVIVGATAAAAGQPAPDDGRAVLVTTVDGPITPVVARHVGDAVERAEDGDYDALVVRLDTPGGLDTSMRDIVADFLAARVPVVVYVSPQGARAASAGALITFAAHVAAMAPGTAIGAATPVNMEGGDVERKVVNDAAAFAEAVARARGRDVEFAVDTVREGRSAAVDEAVRVGAVDLKARTLPELLDEIDGRRVDLDGTTVTLRTADAEPREYGMPFLLRVQQVLADPNLAFLFLSLGTLGLLYEFATPGIGVGGIAGTVFLLLGLFALSVLPVDAVGLLLLLLAAGLFAAEVFAPGIGIAAAGGTVALVLSGLFLFEDVPGIGVSLGLVAPVAVVVGGAVVLAGRLVVRAQRDSPKAGLETFVGRRITVQRADGTRGQAFLEGAWWQVRSEDEIQAGDEVQVATVDGLTLVVEKGEP